MVTLWEPRAAESSGRSRAIEGIVTSLAFSPDGHRLVTIGFDRRVKVWDTATGRETLSIKRRRPTTVTFDPAGERIAIAGVDYAITLYESDPHGELRSDQLELADPALDFAATHDTKAPTVAPVADHPGKHDELASHAGRREAGHFVADRRRCAGQDLRAWTMAGSGHRVNNSNGGPNKVGDMITLEIPVEADGVFDVSAAFAKSLDNGIFNLVIDGQRLGGPLDLFSPEIVHSGEVRLGRVSLKGGENHLPGFDSRQECQEP